MLPFFDCDCSFGKRRVVQPGSFWKLEDLIREMDYSGIGKAMVYHALAREYNPAVGNGMLMEEIMDCPQLVPVWVVMPHHTGEFPAPEELKKQLAGSKIRAVRMFPGASDQNYSLSAWNCGGLFDMLQACRVPLFIGLDQMDWDRLHALCESYPDLPVVLDDAHYRVDRNLYPMLERFANLYVETYMYKAHQGIEELCARFGAHRLIFGSGMPQSSGVGAVTSINYARISDREKRMIAGENLEKLLGGVRYE